MFNFIVGIIFKSRCCVVKKGITLIELIIAIAIFTIAMVGINFVYFAAWNIKTVNKLRQQDQQYSEIITEKSNAAVINTDHCTQWIYFNDYADFNNKITNFFSNPITSIDTTADKNSYSTSSGKYGAFIEVQKTTIGGVTSHHIYIRVLEVNKGPISKSEKDIYIPG